MAQAANAAAAAEGNAMGSANHARIEQSMASLAAAMAAMALFAQVRKRLQQHGVILLPSAISSAP